MIKQKKGFTLVELIVIVTILAILWTVAFISLQWYSSAARDSVRRSNVSKMTTSLELYHLTSGKYPLPDDNEIVEYEWKTLWYQWIFWDKVVSQLSKYFSSVPIDPLTNREYVYSVANNRDEFEILNLLENGLSYTDTYLFTWEASASDINVTPIINGTYNWVFIKTPTHLVLTPSIISADNITWWLILNNTNIKSQVTNLWQNVPQIWNINYNTWSLTWLIFQATWVLDDDSTIEQKLSVYQTFFDAYNWSTLKNEWGVIGSLFNRTTNEEKIAIIDSVVLDNHVALGQLSNSVPNPYLTCTWQNSPEPFAASSTYGLCNTADIIVCSWEWVWFTIAGCNVWTDIASTAFNDSNWYWELFQWWNNAEIKTADVNVDQISETTDNSTYESWFFVSSSTLPSPYDWTSSQNNDLWWDNDWAWTDEQRKWPCKTWYHIPSKLEWSWIHTAWQWWNDSFSMLDDLKMPMAWYRFRNDAGLYWQWSAAFYWSSSPNNDNWDAMYFTFGYTDPSIGYERADGFSVRCFKN